MLIVVKDTWAGELAWVGNGSRVRRVGKGWSGRRRLGGRGAAESGVRRQCESGSCPWWWCVPCASSLPPLLGGSGGLYIKLSFQEGEAYTVIPVNFPALFFSVPHLTPLHLFHFLSLLSKERDETCIAFLQLFPPLLSDIWLEFPPSPTCQNLELLQETSWDPLFPFCS